jgi:hypothetical protein
MRCRRRLAARQQHTAACHLLASSRHRAAQINQLAVQTDDTPALLRIVCDAAALLQITSHQSVAQGVVEGGSELVGLGADEIEETRDVLGSFDRALGVSSQMGLDRRELASVQRTRSKDGVTREATGAQES